MDENETETIPEEPRETVADEQARIVETAAALIRALPDKRRPSRSERAKAVIIDLLPMIQDALQKGHSTRDIVAAADLVTTLQMSAKTISQMIFQAVESSTEKASVAAAKAPTRSKSKAASKARKVSDTEGNGAVITSNAQSGHVPETLERAPKEARSETEHGH